MFVVPVSSSSGKKPLFKAKYVTEKQARYARFALIQLANAAHFAPVDSEINESAEKFIPAQKWSVGDIVEEKDN